MSLAQIPPPLLWLAVGCGAFVLINAATYLTFRLDKMRAIRQDWRIPEATLLTFALMGGWFGAKHAQKRLRHKTRKEPFRTLLNLIPVFWLLTAAAIVAVPLL